MTDITFATVVYNTKELFERSYNSLKTFYPEIGHLIIDGSDMTDECYWYVDKLGERVFHTHRNIGHGSGMHLATELVSTKYICFYDTDIEMQSPCIEEMLTQFNEDTYGVGKVYSEPLSRFAGRVWRLEINKEDPVDSIKILHPHFCVINKELYKSYAPIISNSTPFVMVWLDLFRRGLDYKTVIDFPVEKYVKHYNAGTRDLSPETWHKSQGHIDWRLAWDRYARET